MFEWPSAVAAAIQADQRVIYRGSKTDLHGAVAVQAELCACRRCLPVAGFTRLRVDLIHVIDVENIRVQQLRCARPRSFRIEAD